MARHDNVIGKYIYLTINSIGYSTLASSSAVYRAEPAKLELHAGVFGQSGQGLQRGF